MEYLVSINPYDLQLVGKYKRLNESQMLERLDLSQKSFEVWKNLDLKERTRIVRSFGSLLSENKKKAAEMITLEMGKPIKQSFLEIDKCLSLIEIYSRDFESLVREEYIETVYPRSYVTFEPLGPILGIMPWNFPFWQVLRFAIPNVLLGNTVLLKHASNVQGSAHMIESFFKESGFPEAVFINLCISAQQVEPVIKDERVMGVTLTGSDKAGSAVASLAGREIKKTVMELGGSDPFLVLSDADIGVVCQRAVSGRIRNAGQSCTSPKRFIVMEEVYDDFVKAYVEFFSRVKIGDPMDLETELGPLVSEPALNDVLSKVEESITLGAKLEYGGKRIDDFKGFFMEPTVLSNVSKGMPVYEEEVFGPVAVFIRARSIEEMIHIANDTKYGLSSSIWTRDLDKASEISKKLFTGSVYINAVPSSDPRMPFGGVKKSGYGRELSKYGILEFSNIKSVIINDEGLM